MERGGTSPLNVLKLFQNTRLRIIKQNTKLQTEVDTSKDRWIDGYTLEYYQTQSRVEYML